ncbi:RNA polymerase sigma factor [Halobacteriovorax sp. HLS]|uniref:RNA polymerase sigma factor n=1 Tax=Halobacteriovorax sp. HLS TaxID=2234000 RepID=UPI000FD6E2CD|nr:sigma-70 family RNA polymerase sigma factor [Halobacteriovorax sp. HLS]
MILKMKTNFSSIEFLESIKNGEDSARDAIVRAYTEHLYKAALGQGLSNEQAHDVAHSTWMTFFDVVHRFEGRSHIRTFLFGIFYNKVSELRRSNLKYSQSDPIDEIMESKFQDNGHWKEGLPGDPERFLDSSQGLDIISLCLDELPELQKAVFQLKVVEEDESEEICNILDITTTNLRQLLYRAKSRLRECVERKSNA